MSIAVESAHTGDKHALQHMKMTMAMASELFKRCTTKMSTALRTPVGFASSISSRNLSLLSEVVCRRLTLKRMLHGSSIGLHSTLLQ